MSAREPDRLPGDRGIERGHRLAAVRVWVCIAGLVLVVGGLSYLAAGWEGLVAPALLVACLTGLVWACAGVKGSGREA